MADSFDDALAKVSIVVALAVVVSVLGAIGLLIASLWGFDWRTGIYSYDPRGPVAPSIFLANRPDEVLARYLDAAILARGQSPSRSADRLSRDSRRAVSYEITRVDISPVTDWHAYAEIHVFVTYEGGATHQELFRFPSNGSSGGFLPFIGEVATDNRYPELTGCSRSRPDPGTWNCGRGPG
ncbi:MAG: hypothetical protein IT307_13070 [Chloroflexi bacterium]|nr:hypothetical protein [Chloroflexota bacterium]